MNSRDLRLHVNNSLMLSRTILSLTLTIAVLAAPAAPIEFSKITSPHAKCSPSMQIDPCQRCPLNSNQTNSNSGSACCSVQASCFVGYANASDEFVAGMDRIDFASFANDRVSARFQRPPVPPPRLQFS